jgi:hypothetical protein
VTSVRQLPEPVPLHHAVAEVLALSDERDAWLRRLDGEHRGAFRLGYALGVEIGRRQVLDEEAEARRAAIRMVRDAGRLSEVERRRWTVRGEARTRATFGEPHPADYPGRGAA